MNIIDKLLDKHYQKSFADVENEYNETMDKLSLEVANSFGNERLNPILNAHLKLNNNDVELKKLFNNIISHFDLSFTGGTLVLGYKEFNVLILINASSETYTVHYKGNVVKRGLLSLANMRTYCFLYQENKDSSTDYFQKEILRGTVIRHYIEMQDFNKEIKLMIELNREIYGSIA